MKLIKITPEFEEKDLSYLYDQHREEIISNASESPYFDYEIDIKYVKVKDWKKLLGILWPGITNVEDTQYCGDIGHPDYIIHSSIGKVYVELKNPGDGIRYSQLRWLLENKDKEVYFLFTDNKERLIESGGEN